MKLPLPTYPWPVNKIGVLDIANDWYNPSLVALNSNSIANLELLEIPIGADTSMVAGKIGMDWSNSIELSLALNSINYQFWDIDSNGNFIRYAHSGIVGAMGMRKAFESAWFSPDNPISKARSGKPLSINDIKNIFGDIPNPESRADILNEVLCSNKLSIISNSIIENINDTGIIDTTLAYEVAKLFPVAYGDKVLKKAQLAVSEVWVNACEKGVKVDCDLTAFADYQIPNILRAMGVLEYAPTLATKIDSMTPIDYESIEEKAIRGASLLAVEEIAKKFNTPVAMVDHYLWSRRKEAAKPFHLTFTTAY